jgi:hypothetical protein
MNTSTDYSKKIDILHEVFFDHATDSRFQEFAEINDLGLPLAHAIWDGIVESTPLAKELIEQTYAMLLDMFGVKDDVGFESLADIMQPA